ncbi:hypothetical protein BH24DEI2_BH24DEI2_03480 [soil metagenome]
MDTKDTTNTSKAKDDAKEVAQTVATDVKQKAGEAKDHVVSQLNEVKDEVTNQAKSGLQEGRTQVASQVGGVASAVQQFGEQLRSEDHPHLAEYTEKFGSQVKGVADYMENRDIGDIISDVEGFARRQPAAFIGLSLVLGLAAARFLKSSTPNQNR